MNFSQWLNEADTTVDWNKQAKIWLNYAKSKVPAPPRGFRPEYMNMWPKDAMQAVYKAAGGVVTPQVIKIAQEVAQYVYDHSLAPKNVYKRALEFANDRGLEYDKVLAFGRAAEDEARKAVPV